MYADLIPLLTQHIEHWKSKLDNNAVIQFCITWAMWDSISIGSDRYSDANTQLFLLSAQRKCHAHTNLRRTAQVHDLINLVFATLRWCMWLLVYEDNLILKSNLYIVEIAVPQTPAHHHHSNNNSSNHFTNYIRVCVYI